MEGYIEVSSEVLLDSAFPKQPESGRISNNATKNRACRMGVGTSGCIMNMMMV